MQTKSNVYVGLTIRSKLLVSGMLCAEEEERNLGIIIQELRYRKQIARQPRAQYVEGIHRPKYYTVTLKSRLRVTRTLDTEPLDISCTTYY